MEAVAKPIVGCIISNVSYSQDIARARVAIGSFAMRSSGVENGRGPSSGRISPRSPRGNPDLVFPWNPSNRFNCAKSFTLLRIALTKSFDTPMRFVIVTSQAAPPRPWASRSSRSKRRISRTTGYTYTYIHIYIYIYSIHIVLYALSRGTNGVALYSREIIFLLCQCRSRKRSAEG